MSGIVTQQAGDAVRSDRSRLSRLENELSFLIRELNATSIDADPE